MMDTFKKKDIEINKDGKVPVQEAKQPLSEKELDQVAGGVQGIARPNNHRSGLGSFRG